MRSAAAFFVSAVLFLGGVQCAFAQSANSGAEPYSVNCDESASINTALDSGHRYIVFTGVCDEDVFVEGFDRVEIIGSDRARRSNRIKSLTINGPAVAILANFESGNINLAHDITGAASEIAVVDGEFGVRFGSNVLLSGIDVAGAVRIEHDSWAALKGSGQGISSIEGRASDQGLKILDNSSAWIMDGTVVMNHSDEDAVIVANGSKGLIDGGATIVSGGISVSETSSFNVRSGRVSSSGSSHAVAVASQSVLTVRPNVEFIGDIELSEDSTMVNESADPVATVADVVCTSEESGLSGDVTSATSVACEGFN